MKDFEILASPVYKIKSAEPVAPVHSNGAPHQAKPKSQNGKPSSAPVASSSNGVTEAAPAAQSAPAKQPVRSSLHSKDSSTQAGKSLTQKPPVQQKNAENKTAVSQAKPSSAPVKSAAPPVKKQEAETKKAPVEPKKPTEANGTATTAPSRQSISKGEVKPSSSLTSTSSAATKSTSRLSQQAPPAAPKPTSAKKTTTKPPAAKPVDTEAQQKDEKQSRIITKRDPKPSAAKPTAATKSATELAKNVNNVAAASTETVQTSTEVTESIEVPSEPVVEEVKMAENEEDFQKIETSRNEAGATSLLKQNESSQTIVKQNESNLNGWPNLSPVKRDQHGLTLIDASGDYLEDRNNSIDENNESGISPDAEAFADDKQLNCLISDAKDLIQTPEEDEAANALFEDKLKSDIMTRSFIDDGGVNSNPFVASSVADNKRVIAQQDDSENDLNKTHELTDDESADKTADIQEPEEYHEQHIIIKPIESLPEEVPAEQIVEPVEPVEVIESVVEPVVEAIVEPVIEPVVEAIVEPIVEPVVEPIVEPIVEQVVEATEEPVLAEPEVESGEEEAADELADALGTLTIQSNHQEDEYPCLSVIEEESRSVDVPMQNNILSESQESLADSHDSQESQVLNPGNQETLNGHHEELSGEEFIIEEKPSVEEPAIINMKSAEEQASAAPMLSAVTSSVEDPARWNLLELPKPVNPSDLPAPPAINEKKSTPNGKKPNNPSSPSHDSSKSTVKQLSTAGAKTVVKQSHIHPVYVEVSYIPAHGTSFYVDTDFLKKVRARHYVLSTEEPTEKLLNALLEAKESWEEKSLQVSIIPTYESEVVRRWFLANEDTLARLKIDITPAANMSTLTMDDNPDLTCQLYKLEF